MAVYTGYRPVLPGQNANDMVHAYKGAIGTYSNYSEYSSVHLLDEAPLNDVTPGEGKFPGALHKSQQFTGKFDYAPMELAKFLHGGHDVSWLKSEIKLHHGVPAGDVFGGDFGHGARELYYSRFRNLGGLGVFDPLEDAGKPQAGYGETFPNMGPIQPYIYQGAGDRAVEDPGDTLTNKRTAAAYGYKQVNLHHGVDSSSALKV